jgi:hypothetical protein
LNHSPGDLLAARTGSRRLGYRGRRWCQINGPRTSLRHDDAPWGWCRRLRSHRWRWRGGFIGRSRRRRGNRSRSVCDNFGSTRCRRRRRGPGSRRRRSNDYYGRGGSLHWRLGRYRCTTSRWTCFDAWSWRTRDHWASGRLGRDRWCRGRSRDDSGLLAGLGNDPSRCRRCRRRKPLLTGCPDVVSTRVGSGYSRSGDIGSRLARRTWPNRNWSCPLTGRRCMRRMNGRGRRS